MDNIKGIIIKYLEGGGEASKSSIEDYLKDAKGTTGDCVSRRLRELVASGVVSKTQKEYQGKKYFSYRVVENPLDEMFDHPLKQLEDIHNSLVADTLKI